MNNANHDDDDNSIIPGTKRSVRLNKKRKQLNKLQPIEILPTNGTKDVREMPNNKDPNSPATSIQQLQGNFDGM